MFYVTYCYTVNKHDLPNTFFLKICKINLISFLAAEESETILSTRAKTIPHQNDMQNCFGFDDEEEEDDEEQEEKVKPDIHVLQSAIR